MEYIHIENLNFSYDKKKLFDNINIDIKKGSFASLTTSNSKGKTTFLNILSGNILTDSKIYIDGKLLDNNSIEYIKSKITFFSPYQRFYSKTVLDELLLEFNSDSISNINKIKKILKEFNMLNYINESPLKLNYVQCQKLNLIKAILNESEILLIDNIFSGFDKYSKIEFISLIKKYQLDKNITVIYATVDLDDIVFCDKIIIINDSKILYDGSLDKVYMNEKILKTSRVNISMFNELMVKLKLYGIINDKICTIDEVVDEICK